MKNKIGNKLINILILFVILSLSAFLTFERKIGNLDELWQYSFANNLYNGLVPYKDFNIIATPFYPFVASLFLRVFSNQLIVMRIFTTLIFTIILYVAYKIFSLLNVKKIYSLLFVLILYFSFNFDLEVEYNYFILLLTILSLYIELYKIHKHGIFDAKNDFWLGILMGLTIATKHTIGFILSAMFIFYKAIFIKDKKDYASFKKVMLYRLMGVMVPNLILLIYLILQHALYDCINYCILGIMEFKNSKPYFDLFSYVKNILVMVFAFITPIVLTSLIVLIKYRTNSKWTDMIIILIYAISLFIGMFPIVNSGHFLIYGFIGIMATIYYIYLLMNKCIKNHKAKIFINSFTMFFVTSFLLYYIIISTINLIKFYKTNNICTVELEHYNKIPVDARTIDKICSIDDFIIGEEKKGKTVYILDATAVLYRIPINQYYKDYDLFNKGNLGKNGEARIIKEISEATNTLYLILQDKYTKNWQTPLNVIDYVKSNKNKIGKIGEFDIYE